MYNDIHPRAVPTEIAEQPIGMFFLADKQPYHRLYHCPSCGLPIIETSNRLVYIIDNPGLPSNIHSQKIFGYFETKCKRSYCKQRFRIFSIGVS